jgi:hypothetical protein
MAPSIGRVRRPFARARRNRAPETVEHSGARPVLRSRPMSVVIIHHELSLRKYQEDSLLALLGQRWKRRGIKVSNLYGANAFVPADIAFVHVDLSVVPKEYCDLAKRYPLALNAFVTDIRKRNFSTLEVTDSPTYDGPVIVKTNLNSGGLPERRIRRNRWPGPIRAAQRALENAFMRSGLSSRADITFATYRAFPTAKDVPPDIFNNPDLIVERFVPERQDGWYCYRRYYFLGDSEVSQLWLGTQPICEEDSNEMEVHEAPIPAGIREFRRKLSIDYGKIDYVLDEAGRAIVLDVNKTPGGVCRHPEHVPWFNDLCDGLEAGILNLTSEPRDASQAANGGRSC